MSSDIDGLLQKVNINSAFLNLARNDSDLINDMKEAIVQLYSQAKRREILYIAIEHNTKYLTEMSQTIEKERNIAVENVKQLKIEKKKQIEDTAQMTRQFKVLQKESD